MDTTKMMDMLVAMFERQTISQIRRLQEDIQQKREMLKVMRSVAAEFKRPPKPFKFPKMPIARTQRRRKETRVHQTAAD